MRWPWVARIGAALAVVAVIGALVAAFLAAFVIDRDGDERLTGIEQVFDTDSYGSSGDSLLADLGR